MKSCPVSGTLSDCEAPFQMLTETTLQTRELGGSGVKVSAIGLGCWGMSGSYGAADEKESAATLNHAIDLGINLLDTADSYGKDGHNESLIGRTLKARRGEFLLATKTGWVSRTDPSGKTTLGVDCRPERIKQACEASLNRLRTDVIDLYYLHRADPNVPIEDSVGALGELVAEGKVRFIGLSEVLSDTLRRAHAVHSVTALQSEYSLWTRDVESTVLLVCESLGISFVPFSPLGRGFLTATLNDDSKQFAPDDWRANNPRFSRENLARNRTLLATLTAIASSRGCTPGQVALAWVLSRGDRVIPIPGTKRRSHLDENVNAPDISLHSDEISSLDAAFPPGAASGARYLPEHARWAEGP
jgi:aryl-alcohol dehydrogenase-like predicted oxidoreductase